MNKIVFPILFFIFCWLTPEAYSYGAQPVNHKLFADFLHLAVNDGKVDYQTLKKRESMLDSYLEHVSEMKPDELGPQEQYAFYINSYNGWTIKLILMNYPGVKSIKDLGSFFQSPWKKKICRIDGKLVSLDYIEHEILRPRFKDARIHFAVNCASKGCPPLQQIPYEAGRLDEQLDKATIDFINDPQKNYLQGNSLYVSSIFKWYEEDFKPDVLSLFIKYSRGEFQNNLKTRRQSIDIKYLDYDWSLNGK